MSDTLYAALAQSNTTSDLYTVDPVTLATASVGPIGFALTGMAVDPTTSILYGLTSNNSGSHPHSIITIDPATGAGTFVANIQPISGDNVGATVSDICFSPSGQMYGSSTGKGALVQIDKATGASSRVTTTATDTGGGTDFDGSGTLWWITGRTNVYTLDPATGVPTYVTSLPFSNPSDSGNSRPVAASFHSDGKLWFLGNFFPSVLAYHTDPGTDFGTDPCADVIVGTLGDGFDALVWVGPPPTPPTPAVSLSPTSGPVGTTVTATGTGFSHLETITATFNGSPLTLLSGGTSNGSGAFTATFIVPSVPPGTYAVTFTDTSGHSASATFTVCTTAFYSTLTTQATYPVSGPYAAWSGYPEWDIIAQQNQSSGDDGAISPQGFGYTGDDSAGCIYRGVPCMAWVEYDQNTNLSLGVFVGTYDGTTATVLGSGFDTGVSSGDLSSPVVATDGTNLYLAYLKLIAANLWGYEVWKYDGAAWSHLYSYSSQPARLTINEPSTSNRSLGFSGPKLCASPIEPGAVYVGFKESGVSVLTYTSPAGFGPQNWKDRTVFTVHGLDSGATVPGETVIYDDAVFLTGYPTAGGGTTVPSTWFGFRCEFQIVNDGGRPVVFWNAPAPGAGWVDNKYHLLDLATMTDLFAWGSQIGNTTYGDYQPVGAFYGDVSPSVGGPVGSSGMLGYAAIVIAQNLYSDPLYHAPAWIVMLKFGPPSGNSDFDQGEFLIISVRTDGSAWHVLYDNPTDMNKLLPGWFGNSQLDTYSIVADHNAEYLWCAGDSSPATAGQAMWEYDNSPCHNGWLGYSVNLKFGALLMLILDGDVLRAIGRSQDFHAIDPVTYLAGTFWAVWYSLQICRDCANCGCSPGLHVWFRL